MISEIYNNVLSGDTSQLAHLMKRLYVSGEWRTLEGEERSQFRYLFHLWKTLVGQDTLTVKLKSFDKH